MSDKNILSKEEVRKVAELARIELTQQEEEKFSQELNSILEYFKNLNSVEDDGLGQFDHYKIKGNEFREDEVTNSDKEERRGIKELFPKKENDYLNVKAVLNGK